MTVNPACPSDIKLLAFVTAELDAKNMREVSLHLPKCATCQHRVTELQNEFAEAESLSRTATSKQDGISELEASELEISELETHEPTEAISNESHPQSSKSWTGPILGTVAGLLVVGGAILAWQMLPGGPPKTGSPETVASSEASDNRTGGEGETAGSAQTSGQTGQTGQPGSRLLGSDPLPQQPAAPEGVPEEPRSNFRMGNLDADLPIESIKVTLMIGDGEPLRETVDLHLGFGFPLRLQAEQATENKSGFAAFPQTSSQTSSEPGIPPGGSAWYEFVAQPTDNGFDELARTPQLLRDLQVGDISRLGFASAGQSKWVLDGYQVEVNGRLFAANDSLAILSSQVRAEIRSELDDELAKYRALVQEIEEQQAAAQFGFDVLSVDTAGIDERLRASGRPINHLAGILGGAAPWFVESSESFKPSFRNEDPLESIVVRLQTSAATGSGSRNPIYVDAGGKKFLLSSELDPLSDGEVWTAFELGPADLMNAPLWRSDFRVVGIGMLGSDLPLDVVPDRAQITRIVVEANGTALYDSMTSPTDSELLANMTFVPPAHRDQRGAVISNLATNRERYAWHQGESAYSDGVGGVLGPLLPEPQYLQQVIPPNPPTIILLAAGTSNPPISAPWGNGIAPPLRKMRPNWRGLNALAGLLINALGVNNPASAGIPSNPVVQPPVVQNPLPGQPVIFDVQFDTRSSALHDRDNLIVTWKVKGDRSKIAKFRADIYPVLPHEGPLFVSLDDTQQFQTTAIHSDGSASFQAVLTPNLQAKQTRLISSGTVLKESELLQLFVQPRVIAFAQDGTFIAAGLDSPIWPLFPAASDYANGTPSGDLTPTPVFQLMNGTQTIAKSPFAVDGSRVTDSAAWMLHGNHASQHGILFGEQVRGNANVNRSPTARPIVSNVAARSSNPNAPIRIEFVGLVNLDRDFHVISHIGFINETPPPANSALVDNQALIHVQLRVSTQNPTQTMEISTKQPIQYRKLLSSISKAPLQLIDLPIKLGADMNHTGVDPATYDFKISGTQQLTPAALAQVDLVLTVSQSNAIPAPNTNLTEALGVFGSRLVPGSLRTAASPRNKSTFTIFAHGTGGHRDGRDSELISDFGAAYWGRSATSDVPNATYQSEYQKSFLILDGVGTSDMVGLGGKAIGVARGNHPMPGDFNPLAFDKLPLKDRGPGTSLSRYQVSNMRVSDLPQFLKKGLNFSSPKVHRGTIHGDGWNDNVAHTLAVLKQLEDQGTFPTTINMVGWSRGAVTCLKLANAIDDYFVKGSRKFEIVRDYADESTIPDLITVLDERNSAKLPIAASTLSVNLFLIDPVPGRFGLDGLRRGSNRSQEQFSQHLLEQDYQRLPSIVDRCIITLANDEQRQGFAPLDADDIQVSDPQRTQVVWLPFPGIHRTQLRLTPRDPTDEPAIAAQLTAVPHLVWDLAWRFMHIDGAQFQENILARPQMGGGALTTSEVVELFSDVWLQKENYHLARNSGPMQYAQGFFGPRIYTGYPPGWSTEIASSFASISNLASRVKNGWSNVQLSDIPKLTREKHSASDLFTKELGVYVFAPGFFINEYHRGSFEKAYPRLYGFLTNPASQTGAVPPSVDQELRQIKSSSANLWKTLAELGISDAGTSFNVSSSFRFGENLGGPTRDGQPPLAARFTGQLAKMNMLP